MLKYLIFALLMADALATEMSLTFILDRGKKDCFYHSMPRGTNVELEFQVIHGGDLDGNYIFIMIFTFLYFLNFQLT